MDYLLEALKRRELFSWLHLTPLTFWHALLLRDRFNFLGLVAPVPDSLKQQLSQQPGALTQVRTEGQHLWVLCSPECRSCKASSSSSASSRALSRRCALEVKARGPHLDQTGNAANL